MHLHDETPFIGLLMVDPRPIPDPFNKKISFKPKSNSEDNSFDVYWFDLFE